MPRYSVTVTVRVDAQSEEHAADVVHVGLREGINDNEHIVDYTIDDFDNEDEGHEDEQDV